MSGLGTKQEAVESYVTGSFRCIADTDQSNPGTDLGRSRL